MAFHVFLTNPSGFNHILCHDGLKFYVGDDLSESVVFDNESEVDRFLKTLKTITVDNPDYDDYDQEVLSLVRQKLRIEKIA